MPLLKYSPNGEINFEVADKEAKMCTGHVLIRVYVCS